MLHKSLALALAVPALAAAGCGSSKTASDSASTAATGTTASSHTATTADTPVPAATVHIASGPSLSHAQWQAQANQACLQANRLNSNAPTASTRAELTRVLLQRTTADNAQLAALVKLVPPAQLRGEWQRYLDGLSQRRADTQKLAEVVQAGGFSFSLPLLSTTQKVERKTKDAAVRLGLHECAA